jgi:SpoVK/Ycf46/Vps4 family AAA+-type ATPase
MQPEAREMGLDLPKGYLALGIPGSSKTYAAEAVANDLGVPFLKLNMSSILTKFVGESERKIAQARLLIESCAPCVLLIDEVEKALGGYQSSNASDSGTLARVFGTVLEMLNDNKNGIFTIMTSNNVKDLPPELTRTGRLDAIWYFSTPTLEERKDIFKVHLNKKGLKVKDADIKSISEQTNEYTGAEIEQIVKVAMKKAYLRTVKEGKKTLKVTLADLEAAKNDVIPVAISSQEKIRDLEEWVKGRALYASEETTTSTKKRINTKAIKSASELLANK